MELLGLGESQKWWVRFNDAEVLMRYVGLDELRAIRQSAARLVPLRDGLTPGGLIEDALDMAEADRQLCRAAVCGWRGFTMGGEEYAYTPERADFLMARWSEFARFVGRTALDLAAFEEARIAEVSKNSVLTSGPGGTTLG